MKTFHCSCGNKLYFENSLCLACQREVGWCPVCKEIHAMEPKNNGSYQCTNPSCKAILSKCYNYSTYNICNRMVDGSGEQAVQPLCDYCRLTETIPDLSVPGNITKWYKLEVAKRRLLYLLDFLGLPYGSRAEQFELPLSFDFKEDLHPGNTGWKGVGQEEKVYTGHANGKITINIQEADSVERERLRVDLGEAQRTLIGHFRHEIGHYYWQLLVQGKDEEAFKALYGDHDAPTYSEALDRYYANGPKPNWTSQYISAYASMHPWEDFAETWGAYLDMVSVLDTADNTDLLQSPGDDLQGIQLKTMLNLYADLSLKVNEVNRSMGLPDLLPETFTAPVVEKLGYIHKLVKRHRKKT